MSPRESLVDRMNKLAARKMVVKDTRLSVPEDTREKAATIASTLVGKLHKLASKKEPGQYAEINRIIGLPVVSPWEVDEAKRDRINKGFLLAKAYQAGERLFDIQIEALLEFKRRNGLFAAVGVGWGKTLISLMIAEHCISALGMKRGILIVPAQVYSQLMLRDVSWARNMVPITMALYGLGGCSRKKRAEICQSKRNGCYVMTESLFSVVDTDEMLQWIKPEFIIIDEAHKFKNHQRARTKRLMAYIKEYEPLGACLSGTVTSKSVDDYHHLISWCLGQNSPLPLPRNKAMDWACVLDTNASPSRRQQQPLQPLVDWAMQHFPQETFDFTIHGFRKAYKYRWTHAPGVVATGDMEIGTSLVVECQEVKGKGVKGFDLLQKLVKQVQDKMLTPNGDEIEHAIHAYKWLSELSAGFYNELYWPSTQNWMRRTGDSESVAKRKLTKAKNHHAAVQEYHRTLRDFFSRIHIRGLDTPMLVGRELSVSGCQTLPANLYMAWREAKYLEFDGMPTRMSRVVRVCPFKINRAVEWAKKWENKGGLIWVYHKGIAKWLEEEVTSQGIDHVFCPAGADTEITSPSNAQKVIIASILAHGTGKNLQHFQNQTIVQWPRHPSVAEQLLGRTHRNGQEADELVVEVMLSQDFESDALGLSACLNDSVYIQQTTGNRQKVLSCSWNPVPVVLSSEVLHELGLQNRILDEDGRKLATRLFRNG